MQSAPLTIASKRRLAQRVIWWGLVIVYTVTLPWVIIVFNAINRHFSSDITANLPHFIIIFLGVVYAIICPKDKNAASCIIILAAGASIVFFIMNFETNSNKYIHIPEYTLMTWILYRALVIDYRSSGVLLLVFICTAMLGIVDEILQGIHPQRTYGWKDMIIDTASGFIGILMLLGLKKKSRGDWNWIRQLGHFKGLLAILIFGAATAVPMCIYLFDAQIEGDLRSAYPRWLLWANGLFLAISGAVCVFHWLCRQRSDKFVAKIEPDNIESHASALLWVMCPLVILIVMQGLLMFAAIAGVKFN